MKKSALKYTVLATAAFAVMFMVSCKKKPVACYKYDVENIFDSVYVNKNIHFESCSENEQHMEWNMGDGTKFTYPVVDYVYTNPGVYQVTLTVWNDNDKNQDMKTEDIIVYPE